MGLDGKRALVSGSGTGIGYGIALEFARRGADVVVHYGHQEDGARRAVEAIQALGRRSLAVQADFADADNARRLGESAVEFLGGMDILVNNAGITWNREFDKVTVEQFDRLYHVNVRSPYFLTQACLPSLVESHGSIVNITSIHGISGKTDHSVYAGTKGAIIAWTRQLAIELAPRGVRVNAIAPGAIYVDSYRVGLPDYDPDTQGIDIPCGFVGMPIDIANAAAFLASDEGRFILGQTLVVDGGTTSWMPFGEGYKQRHAGQLGQGYVPDT